MRLTQVTFRIKEMKREKRDNFIEPFTFWFKRRGTKFQSIYANKDEGRRVLRQVLDYMKVDKIEKDTRFNEYTIHFK